MTKVMGRVDSAATQGARKEATQARSSIFKTISPKEKSTGGRKISLTNDKTNRQVEIHSKVGAR